MCLSYGLTVRSFLFLVLFAGAAHAAPIASLVKDVDGDKLDDKIELSDRGELTIETKRSKGKIKLDVKRATLRGGFAHNTPTVIVLTDTEAIVFQLAGTWKQVAKAPVGGVGLDADYSLTVDVTDADVYRYQARPGLLRCDGKPALLFAERLEGGKFQPVAKLPVGLPAGAKTIAARVDAQPASTPAIFKASAASHQVGAPDAGALAIPSELDDGKPTTYWHEELASAGEGQFFTFRATVPAKATQIRIVPANAKGTHGPQKLAVFGEKGALRIELPNPQKDRAGTAYIADLPTPLEGCLDIVIESSYGTSTAIAELEVFAEGERTNGGDALLAKTVKEDGQGSQNAAHALGRHGASAVAAIDAELAKTNDAKARVRLVRALAENRDPAAGPLLAKAATQAWVEGPDLIAVIRALATLNQPQGLYDLAVTAAVPLTARIAAVHAFKVNVAKDQELLVQLAGRGPREQRQAVIEKLTDVPIAVLAPAAQAATKPSTAGDLFRAITRRAHANAGERGAALAAMTAALPGASDYERRYRLVDGIAAVGDVPALRSLQTLLQQLPANHETAAFKQVAARAIAVNRRPEAYDLALALTRDPDPGVRLAALSALAGAGGGTTAGPWHGPSGPDGVDRVLVTSLATDNWPEVRRYAAQLLGSRCMRIGPAKALFDSVARERDLDVRGDALAALVECKAGGTGALLVKLWDGKSPLPLRQRAVDLAVPLGDRSVATKLVAKYNAWRGRAIENEDALALAKNAAWSIGKLDAPGAADALYDALDDSAFPELVAAAAQGLGFLGPACPAKAKTKLTALAKSDEQQIATASAQAAAVCGKK